MLCHLHIKNLAIVKNVEVDWHPGMTTITGETGAGKSIGIDALSLCLGERADASMVRPAADKTEITATFDISSLPSASQWLTQQQLLQDDAPQECIIRRVISKEGRSRAYINGSQVPLQQLRSLGEWLISIHGQHAHQQLTKPEHQRYIVDEYANHEHLLTATKQAYYQWKALIDEQNRLLQKQAQQDAQRQLLEYQVQELDEFDFQPDEWNTIENEHKRLSNAHDLQLQSQQQLAALYEGEQTTAHSVLSQAAQEMSALSRIDDNLTSIADMLFEAAIQVEEAGRELSSYVQNVEIDPTKLQTLDERLGKAVTLARKHNINPQQLAEHHAQLAESLSQLQLDNDRLASMEEEIQKAFQNYQKSADKLSTSRHCSATKIGKLVTSKIKQLSMEDAKFRIDITSLPDSKPNALGYDQVEFQVSANKGQPLQPIIKVASGGELSRISLAIQVIIGNSASTPTMIFDEVDVGISGPTANSVGKLLQELGEHTQVICVTHLPQVAAKGHQQCFVSKITRKSQTETSIKILDKEGRITELARLLGGENITQTTLDNALELLAS